MGLRDDALKRIVGLDASRSAQLSLRTAQEQVKGNSGAVFAVGADRRYKLFSTTELDEEDLSHIAREWSESRQRLLAGHMAVCERWALLPVGQPVAGLLYLGGTEVPLSVELLQGLMAELGQLFEIALELREKEPEAQLVYETIIQHTPLRQLAREKIILVLRACGWNKTKAAEYLGTTRATLYKWMHRHSIEDEEPS